MRNYLNNIEIVYEVDFLIKLPKRLNMKEYSTKQGPIALGYRLRSTSLNNELETTIKFIAYKTLTNDFL